MIVDTDTICAIATPSGIGALAVIRVSGSRAKQVIDSMFRPVRNSHSYLEKGYTLHFGEIIIDEQVVDEVLLSIFNAPHSFTGEDSVEISCHGSVYIQHEILKQLIRSGARLAKPGEFTQRAFLHGKLDLSQAEAVADLIASTSHATHSLALSQLKGGYSKELLALRTQLLHFLSMIELELDFSEEDVEFANRDELQNLAHEIHSKVERLIESFSVGNAVKTGIPVSIVGEPNVGKSTLLNTLLQEDKALVTDIAGTTRDVIEDKIVLKGKTYRFMDTAGIRETDNKIEQLGIEKTYSKIQQARIVLVVIDAQQPYKSLEKHIADIKEAVSPDASIIIAINKIDAVDTETLQRLKSNTIIAEYEDNNAVLYISAKEQNNIEALIDAITQATDIDEIHQHDAIVTNIRHYESLQKAQQSLHIILEGIEQHLPNDLLSIELRQVLYFIGEITGSISNDEMLGYIFANFCIGK